MPSSVKFSVLGKGLIGTKHQYFINMHPNAQLVSTIDSDLSTAADFDSIESFIESDRNESDVVCITSPNGLHEQHAVTLLNASYHVVIEKPMALNRASAELIIEAARMSDRKIFLVMQNRYSAVSKWFKTLVDDNILGNIYLVQINCFWNRDERYYHKNTWHGKKGLDGGTLFTQFSHFIDMLYWCFGDIKNIRSRFFNLSHVDMIEIEDTGFVGFEFEKGGAGQINYSTSSYQKNLESAITVLAEKGTIKMGGQYMEDLINCNIKGLTAPDLQTNSESFGPYKGNAANHRLVIDNIVETLNGNQRVHTSAKDGLAVVDIIERIYLAGVSK